MQAIAFLSVAALATMKSLDAEWLRHEFGLADDTWCGQRAVRIPYNDDTGRRLLDRFRLADGTMRYRTGTVPQLYGLDRVAAAPAVATVIIVEGETDTWCAAWRGVHAVGVPGAGSWAAAFALPLRRFARVIVWEEPDQAGETLVRRVARDLPNAWRVGGDVDIKDLSDLHLRAGAGFADALAERLRQAVPIGGRVAALIARDPAPPARRRPPLAQHQDGDLAAALERARGRDIESVMADYGIDLRRHRAPCPFREHRSPLPFAVDRAKGLWHCFACQQGGDAIDFVMRIRSLDFRGAVRELAAS